MANRSVCVDQENQQIEVAANARKRHFGSRRFPHKDGNKKCVDARGSARLKIRPGPTERAGNRQNVAAVPRSPAWKSISANALRKTKSEMKIYPIAFARCE